MVFEILIGIREDRYTNIRQVMSDYGFSDYLLEVVFQGMAKKGFLQNIDCEDSHSTGLCEEEKYCKGFNSYWLLTDKGKYYINKNVTAF